MSEKKEVITAYEKAAFPNKFEQPHPGSDEGMSPLAEHTQLERWTVDGKPYLEEYHGSGKMDGKAVIVTGGDSGIGRTAAAFFAREGADVTIGYLKSEEQDAQKTKTLIELAGRTALLVPGDLTNHSERENLVRQHLDKFKHLDCLVSNASTQFICDDIANIDMDTVKRTFDTNIIQMIGLCKVAVPQMKRGSSIIFTSSVGGYAGNPILCDYTSTKHAIIGFMHSLSTQLLSKGIRCNAVCPGPVYTPFQAASMPKRDMENMGVGEVPLWNRMAQPAELGECYVFLASNNVITGQSIHANSGLYYA